MSRTLKISTIHFKCGPPCTASPKKKRIGKAGSFVVLAAIGTGATLKFTTSPFKSGKKKIVLNSNKAVVEEVGSVTGTFPYSLSCTGCAGVVAPPSMIVP